MKNLLIKLKNNSLFTFILGGIIFGSIVYATNIYESNSIEYSPTDSSWNVSNVSEAINSLYSMKKELDNIKSLGDAVADNILYGKTAVVGGKLITGTLWDWNTAQGMWINEDNGTFYDDEFYTYADGNTTNEMVLFKSKYSGYFNSNTKFLLGKKRDIAGKIKSGSSFLGVAGTYTSDATATAADIASGKTAYVNGVKLTGTHNGGSKVIDLGTGTSFNVASYYTNYANLTTDNFYIKPSGSVSASNWQGGQMKNTGTVGVKSLNASIQLSYNASSGVLTSYLTASATGGANSSELYTATGTATVHAYLIIN